MVKINKVVKELDPYIPGRSIKEIADEYGLNPDKIIKMGSMKILGTSPRAVDAINEESKSMYRYPEVGLKRINQCCSIIFRRIFITSDSRWRWCR